MFLQAPGFAALQTNALCGLAGRDFFILLSLKAGKQLQRPGGLHGEDPPQPWAAPDPVAFVRWCAGRTGLPFVDAAMHELHDTGYMNNRGRQNVANFLAKARCPDSVAPPG